MQVQPYLNFEGRTEEAIEFYKKALGAKVEMMMRYKESPEAPPPGSPPVDGQKIMHASLRIGDTVIMAADGPGQGKGFHGMALTVSAADAAEARRVFDALTQGGKVNMPLTKTFFSEAFGMLSDKFGVGWMVLVPAAK
jgi:PhnB protein